MQDLSFNRRWLLKGLMNGTAVAVGVPTLDLFLDGNGTAYASGAPLPVRFGTWFWGLGMHPAAWVPQTVGAGYEPSPQLECIREFKDNVSVFSNWAVPLDGAANLCHFTGQTSIRTGAAPTSRQVDNQSMEVLIADTIGQGSRFRSIEVACTGNPRDSLTYSNGNILHPAEVQPAALYTRLFGPDFQDPNSGTFKPDPKNMVMQSVLSAVSDQRKALVAKAGAADRQRLDQYFTSVRELEQQVELQLKPPAPAVACTVPGKVEEQEIGTDVTQAANSHKLFTDMLAMALTCNQTRVVNMVYSNSGSVLRMKGVPATHHITSHEEGVDTKTGMQLKCNDFLVEAWRNLNYFMKVMATTKEGDRSLLDSMLLMAHSDSEIARTHTINGIPIMLAGKAGGKVKSGLHVPGADRPVTQIGYTVMQAMGVPMDAWGSKSLRTNKTISEIFA